MILLTLHSIAFLRNLLFNHDVQELWILVVVLALVFTTLTGFIVYSILFNHRATNRLLNNRRIAEVFEHVPFPMVVCKYDDDGRHSPFVTSESIYSNSLAEEILSAFSIQDLRRRFTSSTVHQLRYVVDKAIRTDTSQHDLFKMKLKSGYALFYVIHFVPFVLHQQRYFLAVAIDVGELYAQDISSQIFRQEKLTFLHNVSNYIGEPLHRIVDLSSQLTTMQPGSQRDRVAEALTLENQYLLNIVENILMYAKIESGTVTDNLAWFDGVNLMKERERLYKSWVPADKDITITMEHPYEELHIQLDISYFATSLNRLVENAILHSDSNDIHVGYFVHNNMFYMWCQDQGCGIPYEQQIRVYERFYKLDSTSARAGMGLALNRMMCEALRGATGMVSKAGQGTYAWSGLPMNIKEKMTENYDINRIQRLMQLRTKGIWFDAFTSNEIKCYGIPAGQQYVNRNDELFDMEGGDYA